MRIFGFMRSPARPVWNVLGLAFLAGCGIGLGQVPVSLWPVAILALGLLLRFLSRQRPAHVAWAAFMAGVGHTCVTMYWITEPFFVEPEVFGWMAPFALALMGAGFGAFWAAGAGLGARLGHGPVTRALGIALGLGLTDAIRSYAFTGFPWVLFGHIWIGTPVAQLASLTGQLGLSCVTLLLAVTLSFPGRKGGLGAGLCLWLGAAAIWGWGQARLATPVDYPARPAEIRIVQPNAEQKLKWLPKYRALFFQRLLDQSSAPAKTPLDLIVWPETSVPFLLNWPGDGLEMVAQSGKGVPIALGIQRSDGDRYYNSLAVLDGQARITALYDKVHLVPFGEYIPFGDALAKLGISAFAAQEGNGYSAGRAETVLDLGPAGQVQPLICYEAVFPQDIRHAPERPDWIMQITNDAWFGQLSGPRQHLSLSQMRAIEFGLPVVRAANTGISGLIDPYGRLRERIGMNREGHLDVAVPKALPVTVYARLGDWPSITAMLVALLLLRGLGLIIVDRPRAEV
ncbi:apolipoprotein N-acyltransferase [Thioclava sp. GXIMD4216]|uniref:apolipoprotein N-acyltransferase n=1 Tax=Thioclava sp. GXIMD4216 TaxID=3131929 RepID=UPI0030D0343C